MTLIPIDIFYEIYLFLDSNKDKLNLLQVSKNARQVFYQCISNKYNFLIGYNLPFMKLSDLKKKLNFCPNVCNTLTVYNDKVRQLPKIDIKYKNLFLLDSNINGPYVVTLDKEFLIYGQIIGDRKLKKYTINNIPKKFLDFCNQDYYYKRFEKWNIAVTRKKNDLDEEESDEDYDHLYSYCSSSDEESDFSDDEEIFEDQKKMCKCSTIENYKFDIDKKKFYGLLKLSKKELQKIVKEITENKICQCLNKHELAIIILHAQE